MNYTCVFQVMSSIKVECVIKQKNQIGESPVWEEKDSSLLYVDIMGKRVSRWNSLTNKIDSIATGKHNLSSVWAAFLATFKENATKLTVSCHNKIM